MHKIYNLLLYNTLILSILIFLGGGCTAHNSKNNPILEKEDVVVWITIGQSNADGSAIFDEEEDKALKTWYETYDSEKLFIWYNSTEVKKQANGSFYAFEGSIKDMDSGWMKLWYKNDNLNRRTAFNIITESWSNNDDSQWAATSRRGMEGEFGRIFSDSLPGEKLYIIKLGVSGSSIDSWADEMNNHNWIYFYEEIYKPAMTQLQESGKRPYLAGVWWMQGCADEGRSKEYYEERLSNLIEKIRYTTGFSDATIYIGTIIAPGERQEQPYGSKRYGSGVRQAQEEVSRTSEGVFLFPTFKYPLQRDSVHFSHRGVNMIGYDLATNAIKSKKNWSMFTTPGEWDRLNTTEPIFRPFLGKPAISVRVHGDSAYATIKYPGFSEIKAEKLCLD